MYVRTRVRTNWYHGTDVRIRIPCISSHLSDNGTNGTRVRTRDVCIIMTGTPSTIVPIGTSRF
jgi:hypothetical protein